MSEETKTAALMLTLDEEQLRSALLGAVEKGIADGVSSYDIQQQIKAAAEKALKQAELARLVGETMQAMLAESAPELARRIAESLVAAITAGTRDMGVQIGARLLMGLRTDTEHTYRQDLSALLKECVKEVRAAAAEGGAS